MITRRENKGFTLIELMIVVAIIAIIAAIAIPGLLRARISSNETSAIGTLKSLATAQEQFKGQALADMDADGTGEYGVFHELAGFAASRSAILADPTFMSANFGTTANTSVVAGEQGWANKSGYNFLIYLPDAAGAPLDEATIAPAGVPTAVAADANNEETNWVCYGWPTDLNTSGNRAFACNQEGLVYQCSNATNAYDGAVTAPAGDDAFAAAGDMTGPIDVGGPGQGGDNWTPAGG